MCSFRGVNVQIPWGADTHTLRKLFLQDERCWLFQASRMQEFPGHGGFSHGSQNLQTVPWKVRCEAWRTSRTGSGEARPGEASAP